MLTTIPCYGCGYGLGNGSGYGDGYGYGSGRGDGYGYVSGQGYLGDGFVDIPSLISLDAFEFLTLC